jgi:hypothetical protein
MDQEEDRDGGSMESKQVKRKVVASVESTLKQSRLNLKVFEGIQLSFTEEQEKIVYKQFLCATILANLPF